MKKIWVNKTDSFKKAEKFDENYYLTMLERERLETMQFLREIYRKIKRRLKNESREGLRRVIRIIQ
jgi:intein/homing endonuclease